MLRASIPVAVLLLFCASSLAGKVDQPGQAKQAPPPLVLGPYARCPVELIAEQGHDGALALAGSSGRPVHAEQVFDLSIKNSRIPRITGAEIEVHGTSPAGRVVALEARSSRESVADAVRTVHLEASVPANQQRTHRVSLRELTSVMWIDVVALQYADGSAWHAGPGQDCRVEPNPVLRVGE